MSGKSSNCGTASGTATYTLEEVGRIFKVTRERSAQVEAKAIRKLQHPARPQTPGLRRRQRVVQRVRGEMDSAHVFERADALAGRKLLRRDTDAPMI